MEENIERNNNEYEIIVIGAGHAGCEAGLIASRMGKKTAMFCTDIESVAMMPCNPSIGGTGKGHLVREIDALGGEMGVNTDKTLIQSKMLNTSKGPAVHSLRVQSDKRCYHEEMLKTVKNQDNLDVIVSEVVDLLIEERNVEKDIENEEKTISRKKVIGIKTADGRKFHSKEVIICTGTFLGGKIFIGDEVTLSGPAGMKPANEFGENLKKMGFDVRRFKTGTPARMLSDTIDYSKMKEQKGDENIVPFSFLNEDKNFDIEQISCWLSYTNETTHKIILENIEKSAMYSGNIVGVGARYCPSIEDKVSRFKDRKRHQLFVEPEGRDTKWSYIQGMSSSLPLDIQHQFYASIPGLEQAEIIRPAYAIEYDCIDPTTLKPSLESKLFEGLFCAGQFNGSSGYEEAAAQGLIAGINAVRKLNKETPLILGRDQAYIGVLIDDLVTKGTNEPYRMMTSRSEYRLLLRQDNADRRLTELGYKYGSVNNDRYDRYQKKKKRVDKEIERLKRVKIDLKLLKRFLIKYECENKSNEISKEIIARRRSDIEEMNNQVLADILARPSIKYVDLAEIDNNMPSLSINEQAVVEVMIKYSGYIKKQKTEVEKLHNLERKKLNEKIDYNSIRGLRIEARQKLTKIKPLTIGQASRISGVSPADINVLLVYLEKNRREK